uniref:Uncharacterized protein n=1 Tax=Arundo donax TaxID=35708 RepID=A0A0A9AGV0_ARUDO
MVAMSLTISLSLARAASSRRMINVVKESSSSGTKTSRSG